MVSEILKNNKKMCVKNYAQEMKIMVYKFYLNFFFEASCWNFGNFNLCSDFSKYFHAFFPASTGTSL